MTLNVVDGLLDGLDLFGVLVGDVQLEGLFEGHHQLHRIERIRAQIVHKGCGGSHLAFIHTELLNNNLLHFFCNRGHGPSLLNLCCSTRPSAAAPAVEPSTSNYNRTADDDLNAHYRVKSR